MAKTTIRVTTGINIDFASLSDYQVVNLRLEYRISQRRYVLSGLIFISLAFLLVILNDLLYDDVVLWMGIIGGLSGMAGIWCLWWTKIYADTRRKCEKELNRRVWSKKTSPSIPQVKQTSRLLKKDFVKADKSTRDLNKPLSCQFCETSLISFDTYLEESTRMKMQAIQESGIFKGRSQVSADEFVSTVNEMKPTKEMEAVQQKTLEIAQKIGLVCNSCKIWSCAKCEGMTDTGFLVPNIPECRTCGSQLEFL